MNQSNQSLETSLKLAEKRAHQHWYQDGLAETAVGLYFLLLALLFYAEYFTQGANISAIGLPIVTLAGVFAMAPMIRRIKAHLTYPRTGYVTYKEPSMRVRWLALVVGLAVGFAIGLLIAKQPWAEGAVESSRSYEAAVLIWLPLAQAAVLAVGLGYAAYRFEVARYYALAGISLVAGLVIMAVRLGDVLGTAVYFTVMFLALITSGLTTLRNYLQQTEPHQEGVS